MNVNFEDTADFLDELLDREREALLNGNLDLIHRVFKEKETLIEELNALNPPNKATLQELNTKLTRNQALLRSALEGIKSVADRFADMRQIRESLDTYDVYGKRKKFEILTKGVVEKRA
ncbi:MAG: flagellar biosynthesis protein FlgN [Roseobacter sp.]